MKILLIHNYYQDPGGESIVFENLIQILNKLGVGFIQFSRRNEDIRQLNQLRKFQMIAEAFYSQNTYRDISKIVEKEKPTVAIVQNIFPLISPSVYPALNKLGIPIIQATYNYRFICPDAHLYSKNEICERCVKGNQINAVIRKCYRNSRLQSAWYAGIIGLHRSMKTFSSLVDKYMVPDQFMATRLSAGGIPSDKIFVNVNPFFAEDYQPSEVVGDYFLFVGRLIRQKGAQTLVKAISMVKSSLPLYIVGDGEDYPAILSLITDLNLQDKVKLLGKKWGEDLIQLVRESRAVIIPSEWYDNLPMLLCQSFAMGKPVIASAINGIPEYVQDGIDGLLFKPGDPVDLARKMDQICIDKERLMQMGIAAREKALNRLDYKEYWKTLNGVIEELVS